MDDTTRTTNGTDRRGLLTCMLWAGTGVIWTVAGGIPRSGLLGSAQAATPSGGFSFAQISDSHIGFARDPNTDTPATLAAAVAQVKAMAPALILHTGDVSHLSRPAEFDTAEKILGASGIETHYVPGEHDMLEDGGTPFIERFQKRHTPGQPGGAFYSFDQQGIHFVGLNNVTDLKAGGLGNLGEAQLAWLERDLKQRSDSTPIVVFAHIPLWTVYADWGWGTDDGARALALLKRFGSVTVLNGHIHQVMQKVEGNVAFHTARSTAFPQPAPGTAPGPGPMKVEAGRLRSVLGVASIAYVPGRSDLAIVDSPLGA
ncbi:metallophosphoesterase family protein [Limobrevibacterium gyesilva]|uniref:Metallophosphoesterase n=1 Tax=Limobrevibacterium gyesilva TaxID=2991712 RepID=A0AA41YLK8_9PROT|nr:metallophosphoesterase [Limobrevibacterium gyesilva]MCW3474502.1 metallophosphoesterase [Limobrevibacterium gyesilva]